MVSVIIPVYNGEKTIKATLDSVFNQTYSDIEVIVVDDGSKDGTLNVLTKLQDRIKLICKENGGVSSARNRGIEEASGDYLVFVDADDLCQPQMIERLMHTVQEQQVQYVIAGTTKIENGVKCEWHLKPAKFNTKQEIRDHICFILENGINSPFSKIFVRQIVADQQIRFNEALALGEDMNFNLEYLLAVDSMVFLDEPLYQYIYDNSTATTSYREDYINRRIWSLEKFEQTLSKHGMENPFAQESRLKLVYAGIFNLQHRKCPYTLHQKLEQVRALQKDFRSQRQKKFSGLFRILSFGIQWLPAWALYAAAHVIRVSKEHFFKNARGVSI